MNRSLHMMTTTFLVIATVFETGCSKRSVPDTTSLAVSDERSHPHNESNKTAPNSIVEPAINKQPLESSQLSESDLTRSSWENPFRPRLWSGDGWQINEESITCESDSRQPATFLRPYRNVVIECRFSRLKENESETTTEENVPIKCEIRLLNRNSNRWTSLSFRPVSITLTESADGANATMHTLRETDRTSGEDHSDVVVLVTLTPNRLLVAVDGQMKLNVNRPGTIMMADCLAQFVVSEADIKLSDLRFEGN